MSKPQDPFTGELEFMALTCPHCQTGVDFLVDLAGTAQGCPGCSRSMVLPRKPGEPATTIPLPMEGARVTLRRLAPGDWKALGDYWEGWEEEELSNWLNQHALDSFTAEGQPVHLGIERRDNPTVIGHFEFSFRDHTHLVAGFQVRVNEAVMTDDLFNEACSLLFVLCFGALNLHRLIIQVPAELEQLRTRLLAAGMRQEGTFRKDRFEGGAWLDTYLFAFLREDYEQRVGAPSA